ncbi:MAG: methanogenesis marker 12 protein [Methanosarcinales archaeon]|nr:methanogenesis marker 12 protein [Methanosarcinales archaeon]
MFIGVDHGTRAIRFASSGIRRLELPRGEAGRLSAESIIKLIEDTLGPGEVELVAITYSMGDGLTRITGIQDVMNRGLLQQDGAGLHVGGGTRVYDALRGTGWPAVLLPGIHRGSKIDPRMKVFSHGASPEKVGLAYQVFKKGEKSFVISDASANTVTLGVLEGRVVGALDAPICAPGMLHGPLDVEAIRAVDAGQITANRAFTYGGILRKMGFDSMEKCPADVWKRALESLALFTAMEVSAMLVLMRDLGESQPAIYIAGSLSSEIVDRVSRLLDRPALPLGNFAAAEGCARIARDVYEGEDCILGLEVDRRVRADLARRAI